MRWIVRAAFAVELLACDCDKLYADRLVSVENIVPRRIDHALDPPKAIALKIHATILSVGVFHPDAAEVKRHHVLVSLGDADDGPAKGVDAIDGLVRRCQKIFPEEGRVIVLLRRQIFPCTSQGSGERFSGCSSRFKSGGYTL